MDVLGLINKELTIKEGQVSIGQFIVQFIGHLVHEPSVTIHHPMPPNAIQAAYCYGKIIAKMQAV